MAFITSVASFINSSIVDGAASDDAEGCQGYEPSPAPRCWDLFVYSERNISPPYVPFDVLLAVNTANYLHTSIHLGYRYLSNFFFFIYLRNKNYRNSYNKHSTDNLFTSKLKQFYQKKKIKYILRLIKKVD